ncbi:MAG TPA: hypothetical protein VJ901_09020 [Thermoanaerobaculia bacterium]|nr:hypothetical protein [Thermoanaerobaculia bacterium]
MIQKKGTQFYTLTPNDGFGVRVTATGTSFFVPASIDITVLSLVDAITFNVTPAMLNGAGSLHQLNLHCFFTPPTGSYTIEVLDAFGTVIDTIMATLPAGQLSGTQMYYQLILFIV